MTCVEAIHSGSKHDFDRSRTYFTAYDNTWVVVLAQAGPDDLDIVLALMSALMQVHGTSLGAFLWALSLYDHIVYSPLSVPLLTAQIHRPVEILLAFKDTPPHFQLLNLDFTMGLIQFPKSLNVHR